MAPAVRRWGRAERHHQPDEQTALLQRRAELLDADAREAVRQAVAEVRLLALTGSGYTWSALRRAVMGRTGPGS